MHFILLAILGVTSSPPREDKPFPILMPAPRAIALCESEITHAAVDAAGDLLVVATVKGDVRGYDLAKNKFVWAITASQGKGGMPIGTHGLAVGSKLALWTEIVPAPKTLDLRTGEFTASHMLIGMKADGTPATPVGLTIDARDRWAWLALREGRAVRYTPGSPNAYSARAVEGAVLTAIASDGDMSVALGCEDGSIRFVNASSAELDEKKVLREHVTPITALAFAGKGGPLVSTSKDGEARVWNVSTGKSKVNRPVSLVAPRAIAIHPKGKWAAIGDDDGMSMAWRLEDGKALALLLPKSGKAPTALIFIDGGKQLLRCDGGTSLQLYDVSTIR